MPKIYKGICEQCEKPYKGEGTRFCSNHCRVTWTNLHRNVAKRPDVRAKFSRIHKGNKYCVGRVLSPATKQKIANALVGRPTGRKPSPEFVENGKATRFSSTSPRLRGEQHPSWKGGLTTERTKDFQTPEYKLFVHTVLERDNYTCQHCEAKNGNGEEVKLQVHHTTPYAELSKSERYNPQFGITLCSPCHCQTRRNHPRPVRHDFVPKPRICVHCSKEFRIKNPKMYCPDCRAKICCPVCGSTTCSHSARKKLNQATFR